MAAINSTSIQPPVEESRRKKILLTICGMFSVLAIAFCAYWVLHASNYEDTENAYVQGNVVQVTSQITGVVSKILVDDTAVVKPGQVLINLDPADADVELAQAEAQLAQTVREVRTLYASHAQSGANLELRKVELARAQDDILRRKALAASGAVSGEEIRHAEFAVTEAQAAVSVANEQLVSGRALTSGTSVAEHPNVLRAKARVHAALLNQSRATLYAPAGGQIIKRNAQVGQHIDPGAPLMAIVPLDQMWVEANFKESQLRDIRVGQTVVLTSDLYGSEVKYKANIIGLAVGTGSAFALLPAQNATGNWIKVVQRIPVRIGLDAKQLADYPLRIGVSMRVSVDLRDQSGTRVGQKSASNHALTAYRALETLIDAKAKARIDAIVIANLK